MKNKPSGKFNLYGLKYLIHLYFQQSRGAHFGKYSQSTYSRAPNYSRIEFLIGF